MSRHISKKSKSIDTASVESNVEFERCFFNISALVEIASSRVAPRNDKGLCDVIASEAKQSLEKF